MEPPTITNLGTSKQLIYTLETLGGLFFCLMFSFCYLTEIDECATATHNCHGVAHCYNSPGSFICRCRDGYTGDGLTCEPIGKCYI